MHISVELPKTRLRRWHLWLIDALKARTGARINVAFVATETPPPTALALVLNLEHLTTAHGRQAGTSSVTQTELERAAPPSDNAPDLCIRLGPASGRAHAVPTLSLTFDGHGEEDALWHALLDRRASHVALHLEPSDAMADANAPADARPGLETPQLLTASADAVMSCAIELIVAQASRFAGLSAQTTTATAPASRTPHAPRQAPRPHAAQSARFLTQRISDKARTLLSHTLRTAPCWQVAWRNRQSLQPDQHTALDLTSFHRLRDDGARYYADPFPVDHNGTTYVFVEEFPYATEQGVISVCTIGPDGHATQPRMVLGANFHLSYPQVFAHHGAHWMIPESSARGGLDLYRAELFPDKWVHADRLIDETLHDATVHFDGKRWWLFAATQFLQSSTWCALKVYSAPDLHGPWQAISDDPVKIDVRSARPAGHVVVQDDQMWRPTQNCTTGYGHGLTWCRVDALTPDRFAEAAAGTMRFAGPNGPLGPHTWTRSATLETVDLFAPRGAL